MKDKNREVKQSALFEEMLNVCALYQSHRMQVYKAAMEITHRLSVNPEAVRHYQSEPLENVLKKAEIIFTDYPQDDIYVHLKLIFEACKFEYYFKHGIVDKANQILTGIKPKIPQLMVHYENYGFPAQLLNGLLIIGLEDMNLYELPGEIDVEHMSEPALVMLFVYQSIFELYQERYSKASSLLFGLVNRVGFKDYPQLFAEIKCLMALVKYKQQDEALFRQNYLSAQRLLRRLDKKAVPGLAALVKCLGILNGRRPLERSQRLMKQIKIIETEDSNMYAPGRYLLLVLKELATPFN